MSPISVHLCLSLLTTILADILVLLVLRNAIWIAFNYFFDLQTALKSTMRISSSPTSA